MGELERLELARAAALALATHLDLAAAGVTLAALAILAASAWTRRER